jgi:putative holliday junction resolvase
MKMEQSKNILGLDIGEKRIGVARAGSIARLPQPLEVIPNNTAFRARLDSLMAEHSIGLVVVGLPRSLNGQETGQSASVRSFVDNALKGVEYIFQDETLSTVTAQKNMQRHGYKNNPAMLDAVAACIILEDYFMS